MPRKTWRAALAAYASPSTVVLLLLGFAAGLALDQPHSAALDDVDGGKEDQSL